MCCAEGLIFVQNHNGFRLFLDDPSLTNQKKERIILSVKRVEEPQKKGENKMFEVIEITENAWGEDEIIRGRFDTLAQAEAFIAETYDEDVEGIYIQDDWGGVVWGC